MRMRPRRRTFVVNPGIEQARSQDEETRAGLRREFAIPPGRPVLGIVGRLQPWKGQHLFLAAIAELRERGHDVHGLVVGGDAYELSPEYAASLERLVSTLGLSEFVTMTGQVPDAAPFTELMDVSVNASDPEPFGIVLIEAMSAGVPVVAVGRGGPLDIVEHGVSGVLASSAEPSALASAVEPLIQDPEFRERIAREGLRRYHERFTAQKMADTLTETLTELADDRA